MDLDRDDVEEPQLCNGGLEQGEAMHASRRCKERENSGQGAESINMIAEMIMASVRNGKIVPIGFMRSSRPLCHAALLRSYIGVPKRG